MKLPFLVCAGLFASSSVLAYSSETCIGDLKSLPEFLLKNDTGASAHWQQKGEAHFNSAMSQALIDADKATSAEACNRVIGSYLKAWRPGHLSAHVVNAAQQDKPRPDEQAAVAADPRIPEYKELSEQTILFRIPSFSPKYREPLAQLINDNRDVLARRANWIIDVRENGGGADSTYAALLPWLMGQGWRSVGIEWLVTAQNLKGQKEICDRYAPGDMGCKKVIGKVVASMEKAEDGSYVQNEPQKTSFEQVDALEPARPKQVAVLMGRNCGSSCEQFLLTVRQSFSVKLIGQRSYGSLDYSNLRPHLLPSKQIQINYATSRSLRLPDMPVDVQGIVPDIYMEKAKDSEEAEAQVEQVRYWLEGGRF